MYTSFDNAKSLGIRRIFVLCMTIEQLGYKGLALYLRGYSHPSFALSSVAGLCLYIMLVW